RHTRFDCDWSSDVCSSDLVFCQSTVWRLTFWSSADLYRSARNLNVPPRSTEESWRSSPTRISLAPLFLTTLKSSTDKVVPNIPRSEERRVGKECRTRRERD